MELNFKFPFPPDFFRKAKKLAEDEPVTHTPIIITDGSASVEFESARYPLTAGTDKHQSRNLYLESIEARNKHTQDTHTCHSLAANEACRIEVTCQNNGGVTRVMTIKGANRATGGSPEIEFDHGIFPRVTPAGSKRHRHFNNAFNITRMEIFRLVESMPDESIHICSLVPEDGKYELTVNDPHVDEDDD